MPATVSAYSSGRGRRPSQSYPGRPIQPNLYEEDFMGPYPRSGVDIPGAPRTEDGEWEGPSLTRLEQETQREYLLALQRRYRGYQAGGGVDIGAALGGLREGRQGQATTTGRPVRRPPASRGTRETRRRTAQSQQGTFTPEGGGGEAGTALETRAPRADYTRDVSSSVRNVLAMIPSMRQVAERPVTKPTQYYEEIKGAMPAADIEKLRTDIYKPEEAAINKEMDLAAQKRADALSARGMGGGGTFAREMGALEGERAGAIGTAMHKASATATQLGLNYATDQMKMSLNASNEEANRALQDVLSQRGIAFDEWNRMAQIVATTADETERRNFEGLMREIDRDAALQLQNNTLRSQEATQRRGLRSQEWLETGRWDVERERWGEEREMQTERLESAERIAREQGYTQEEIAYVTALLQYYMRTNQ